MTFTNSGTQGGRNLLEPLALARTGHRIAAELIARPGGEPVRLLRNGGLKKPMGLYFSGKSGRHLPWESRNELHGFWWAEARSDVLQSWAQPHTLKMTIEGRSCSYTPDRLDELAGGVEVVEVKDVFDEQKDPFYALKLEHARLIYEAIGYRFRLVTRAEIEADPGFSTVALIQRYRSVAVDLQDIDAARAALAQAPATWGNVLEALGGGPGALPRACAMIVRRILAVDPTEALTRDTLVWLPENGSRRARLPAPDGSR
jgi:hypothetical protein